MRARIGQVITAIAASLAVGTLAVIASPAGPSADLAGLIGELAQTIRDNYVFPDKGEQCASFITEQYESGAYDDLSTEQLAQTLNEQLRELTHDRHFGVRVAPPSQDGDQDDHGLMPAPSAPFGFQKIERLAGNIGYLDLRGFVAPEAAEETVHAAMKMLDGSDALIFDLRQNGGGHPETVQLLCSYLFDPAEPVLLNSLYFRPTDETTEFWTTAELPGNAMPDVPVFVLTSSRTFSAAEEFCYNLQTRGRATLIGETTGGGAHPVDGFNIADELVVTVPVGRAINPITGTNWEGVGVVPDVEVEASKALEVGIGLALEAIASSDDKDTAARAEWALSFRRASSGEVRVSQKLLAEYAGDYGPRHIVHKNRELWYSRDGVGSGQMQRLLPASEATFVIEGVDFFRLTFERDDAGRVSRILGEYNNGRSDTSERDG